MTIAKSIDQAMDLLKGQTHEEEDVQEEEEEDVEKAVELDMVKAEDDEEIAQLIQADDFMVALAQNQDQNVALITKGLEDNMNATAAIIDILKSQNEKIEELTTQIEALSGAPAPRKAAITKSEADELAKATQETSKEERGEEIPLTKSDIVRALSDAVKEGKADALDVVKAESAMGGHGSMRAIEIQDVAAALSEKGKAVVRDMLASASR